MLSRCNKALTLIEVLVTVAILSTAIVFLFRSFATALYVAKFSQDITLGCYLAEDKLGQIIHLKGNLPEAGPEIIQAKNFNWKYEILDTDNPDLKTLKVVVSWKENPKEKEYEMDFSTTRLYPH